MMSSTFHALCYWIEAVSGDLVFPSHTDHARESPVARASRVVNPADLHSRGGGERTRTVGLYIANVALYQLSYTPGC